MLDGRGGLLIQTPIGVMRDAAAGGVPGDRWRARARGEPLRADAIRPRREEYGFVVGAGYDPARELIIDPGLDYSTFLGGASYEIGFGIAVDSAGNAYIAGLTQSPDFPTTAGAFDRTGAPNNFLDAFVTKLNPNGTALVYSTFLGGGNFEWGRAIAIDGAGNAYIAGSDEVLGLSHDRWRLRQDLQRGHLPALRHRPVRRLRHQAERRRVGARLLHVPRRDSRFDDALVNRGGRIRQRVRREARPGRATSR